MTPPLGSEEGSASATSRSSEPAQEERGPTVYVLLRLQPLQVEANAGLAARAHAPWEEIARIEAKSREAAWEEAKRRCPVIVPTEPGVEEHLQLVPVRFWRQITARGKTPPPVPELEIEVDGL
jgi:hypothetical protein